MNKDNAIRVLNVHKTFKLPDEKHSTVKGLIVSKTRGKKQYTQQHVLKDISFDIKKGEFFGIVGKNGGGKSTLLKLLAEIYTPDKGSIQIAGTLTPFIELGVGFNPELTGRENIYLNGALLGFSRREMDKMYGDIVNFAELHKFMDQKLKNYSSGMQVRLAFSIAIRAKSDILLLDEVLAVGDAAFQQKCFDYFEKLKKEKQTIIIVTHDMGAVKRFCDRAMLLRNGQIEIIGRPDEVADLYTEENIEQQLTTTKEKFHDFNITAKLSKKKYKKSDELITSISYDSIGPDRCYINLTIIRSGMIIADINTKYRTDLREQSGINTFKFKHTLEQFNSGTYDICISVHRLKDDRLMAQVPRAATYLIEGYDPARDGAFTLQDGWAKT